MNKLSIPYRGRIYTFRFAANWQEVPAHVLPWLGKNIWSGATLYRELIKAINADEYLHSLKIDEQLQKIRISLLRKMCGITWWPLSRRNRAFYSMLPDEVADVLQSLNFVFKKIEVTRPFSRFRHWFYCYYLPAENLGNLTAGEFHFAEIAFTKAIDGDSYALAQLCAILCRPKGKDSRHNRNSAVFCGDVREPFNRHIIEHRAKHFLSMPGKYKYPVLLWFAGCRAAIIENYPEIFSGCGDGGSSDGWLDIFRALAKNPLSFDQVANKPLSYMLWELAKMDQDRRREELRKLKQK